MIKHAKGWEAAKEMRKRRCHKGGKKALPHEYLKTALGEALEDWLGEQRRCGLRKASIESRRIHIRLFLKWCWNCHVTRPEWISRGLLEAWLSWLEEYRTKKGAHYAANSKESLIRSVNAFLAYLLSHRRIDFNPLAGMRLRRCRGQSIPAILDEAQVMRLLELPDTSDALGLRDRAMLELTYSSGLRRSEVVNLKVSDLLCSEASIMVRNGKGGRAARRTGANLVAPLSGGGQAENGRAGVVQRGTFPDGVWGWILPGRMGPRGSTLFDSGRGRHTRRTTSPAAFLRDPHAGSRGGSTHDPDAARPFAARYDRDLHPRFDGAHAPRSPSDASSWMRALPQNTRARNRSPVSGASSGARTNPVLPFHGCRAALNASLMEHAQRRLSPSGNAGTVPGSTRRRFSRAAGLERGASLRLRRSLPTFSPGRNCRLARGFEPGHGSAAGPVGALFSYYGYRYLDTQLGRWLSRDPIGERGGRNLYEFSCNQPTLWVDLFGREPRVDSPKTSRGDAGPGSQVVTFELLEIERTDVVFISMAWSITHCVTGENAIGGLAIAVPGEKVSGSGISIMISPKPGAIGPKVDNNFPGQRSRREVIRELLREEYQEIPDQNRRMIDMVLSKEKQADCTKGYIQAVVLVFRGIQGSVNWRNEPIPAGGNAEIWPEGNALPNRFREPDWGSSPAQFLRPGELPGNVTNATEIFNGFEDFSWNYCDGSFLYYK